MSQAAMSARVVRAAPEAGAGMEVKKGGMVDTRGPIRNPTFLLSSRPSLHSTPKNGSRRELASG
jgi:hypothetical protein